MTLSGGVLVKNFMKNRFHIECVDIHGAVSKPQGSKNKTKYKFDDIINALITHQQELSVGLSRDILMHINMLSIHRNCVLQKEIRSEKRII